MKTAIVVPAHIPLSQGWVIALDMETKKSGAKVIIVDDSDGNLGKLPANWDVYGYDMQKRFLGGLYEDFARMFHKSSACRIFGHLVALRQGYDVIIGLDSDCIVAPNFVRDHTQFLNKKWGSDWFNTIGSAEWYPRGHPYSKRNWPVVANMGLWKNVLDLNGKDRADNEPDHINVPGNTIATGHFAYSGMNFALTREAALGFLFLPNFNYGDVKFRRTDDIWGGYIFQSLMAKARMSAMVGYPVVYHDTVVDPAEDTAAEEGMYQFEDLFYALVDKAVNTMPALTAEATMAQHMSNFIVHFSNAIDRWGEDCPFKELDPALAWWYSVIKEYGTV